MSYREAFDYEKMAREAQRERDALQAVLERRKAAPPPRGDGERLWERENNVLYTMDLEQRSRARELSWRARARGKGDGAHVF